MADIQRNKRIAKNTVFLYIRMLFLILVQLYTVPILLKQLGVDDYGIYNVVGGIVTLFSFLGGALSSGSQRFLAYAIGKNNDIELKRLFDSTLTIFICFALLLLIISETIGLWFLNNKMTIPSDRIIAANWVYQFSIFSFLISLISIPYNADIVAHEKMSLFAYISIAEGITKLLAAISLKYAHGDLLIIYAAIICVCSFIIRIFYQVICGKLFAECRNIKLFWDSKIGKSLLAYTSWNTIGSLALIARNQGMNLVLNYFFCPALNAAHTIGQHISGVITQLTHNVYMATRPQITKLYARNEEQSMWNLALSSAKWTYFLIMVICIPLILEMPLILNIWLPEIPDYTVTISRLLVLSILIETTVNQIIGVFQAKNRIKHYQIISSAILLLNIPVSFMILKCYIVNPCIPYIVICLLSICYMLSIIIVAKYDVGLCISVFLKHVWLRMVVVTILSSVCIYTIYSFLVPSLIRVFVTSIESVLFSSFFIYTLGVDKTERRIINGYVKLSYKKIKNLR